MRRPDKGPTSVVTFRARPELLARIRDAATANYKNASDLIVTAIERLLAEHAATDGKEIQITKEDLEHLLIAVNQFGKPIPAGLFLRMVQRHQKRRGAGDPQCRKPPI